MQVTATTDSSHFLDENKELQKPLILSTDAHSVDNFGIDEKISFIKMGQPSFECLNEALKFPDTRIRFKSNLPETKPPRILGVRIIGKQNNDKAFFKNSVVGFSDNLTCIIGHRGSGKSTLIDSIRYAMGYNRTLNEIEKVKEQVTDRQEHTLDESIIELLYQKKDEVLHKITSTYDRKETYTTKVYDLENNELNIMDVERCGDYPLNLYGWNELELLGENPKSQRDNLDKFILDLIIFKDQKHALYQKLKGNRKKVESQLEKLVLNCNIALSYVIICV